MPYLSFDVDADYTELIRLQQEIAKTKSQLQNFRPGQAGASIDALNKKLAESTSRYRQLAQAAIRSGADMEFGIKKNLSGIFTEVNRIQDLLTRPMMAVGGLAGVYGLGEFLSKITSIRGQFQQMNASIETMIGKRKGEKLNAELQEFAKISPLEFAPTVSTAQMMLGFGIDADKVTRYLQAIGDIAMGDTRRFQSLSLAFSQMSAAGKLMGQDLMQMVNAGFQPLQIISEKTGKSIGTLKEEMSQGKISAEMVQQAFLDATSEGGKYYKMSETASKTIPGAIAKLNDSMDLMFNDMGQNMEGALVGVIDAASTIVENIGRIIPVLATAAAAFGVYKTSVMLSNFAAKQSVIDASKGIVDGFNAELAKIQEMQNAKLMEGYDDDIRKALEKGSIDQTYADSIQQGRLWQQEQQRIAENERRIAEEAQKTYETHLKDMQTQREEAGRGLDADINDSNANGIITNDTAERLQNERDYAQALVDTKQAALDSANMQKAASDQLVEAAERRVESAKELMEMAEAAGDADDKKAAAEEYMAAVEEQASAITAQQSAAEGVNTAEKELNGAITAQQAVQKQTETAAVIGETTATTANTAATNLNTTATSRGTVVTAIATAKDKAATVGKYALTAATNACKKAWDNFKNAFKANPIGMLITGLTTVIGLFMSFKGKTSEASAEVERFGEAAIKTKNNAQTLYAVLAATTNQSKVHKDALSELEKIAKDYGIVLDEEKNKYEQLIKYRERLIGLIMEEGRQRQIANNIASYQEEQDNLMNDFREKMVEHIKDENDDEKAKASATVFTNLFLEKVSEKRKEVIDIIRQLDELEKELSDENSKGNDADKEVVKRLKEEIGQMRTSLLEDMNEQGRKVAQEMGVKYQLDLNDMYGYLREYVVQLDASSEAMETFVNLQEQSRHQLEALTPDTLTDYSTAQVEDLTKSLTSIQAKMNDVNGTTVSPKVNSLEIKTANKESTSAKENIDTIDDKDQKPNIDASEIKDADAAAQNLVDKGTEIDNISATPYIGTDYIDIALSKAGELSRRIASLDGNQLQFYNMDDLERGIMDSLLNRVGDKPKGEWNKVDQAIFDTVLTNIKDKSTFDLNGQSYNLTPELAAIYQELQDNGLSFTQNGQKHRLKGDTFKAIHPEFADKYDYFISTLLMSDSERQSQNWDYLTGILDDRAKTLKSTEDYAAFRKKINSAMEKVDQDSEQYKYYERLLKDIDKRDKSKKNKDKDDPKQRAYERHKIQLEEERRTAELLQAESNRQYQLELDMRRDSSDKEIDVIRFEAKKKREALLKERQKEADRLKEFDRQQWLNEKKGRKAYQWQQTKSDDEYLAQAGANVGYDTQLSAINVSEEDGVRKVQKEIAATMLSYLKEFGTFQQKRYAIEQEYAEKLLNARNEGERLTLESQKQSELQKLDIDAIKQQIDWGSMFGDFGTMLSDQVQPTIDKLEATTKTEKFRNSTFEEQKAVYELITTLKGTITEWDSNIFSTLGDAVTAYQTAMRNNTAAVEAESQARALAEAKAKKLREIEEKNRTARSKGEEEDLSAEATAREESEKAIMALGVASEHTQQTTTDLANAQQNLSNSTTTATNMFSQLSSGLQSLSSGSLQGVWSGMNQLSKVFTGNDNLANKMGSTLLKGVQKLFGDDSKIGQEVSKALSALGGPMMGEIVGMFFSILDILKDGIGNFIASLIDTVLGAVNGLLNSVLSGEIVTSIGKSVLTGVGNILDTVSFGGFSSLMNSLGLSGDSDKHLEEDIERLTATNEALRKAVDNLADEMRDAATADMGAMYQQQKSDIEKAMKNTQEMMSRAGAAYSNGFLGIGGHHSSNKKINDGMRREDWSRISAIVGKTISSAGDFWNLTSEQMAKVAQNAPDLYAKIKGLADDGHKDAAQFMDEYIEYYKELEELENTFRESLTDVSFDSVKDEFKSMLLDMKSDSEDFANNFEKMMQQAVINSLMNSKYKDKLQDWYKAFSDAMNDDDGLTESEQERLKKNWDSIVSEAINDRDRLRDTMGWASDAYSQKASSVGVTTISEDTGLAIEGRLTALQIAVESIQSNEAQHTLSLVDMTDELLQIAMEYSRFNVHQDNIERQLAKIYIELQTISENTGAIVKPIQMMQADIAEIKKNTKNL